jgi:hypothetical protein
MDENRRRLKNMRVMAKRKKHRADIKSKRKKCLFSKVMDKKYGRKK